MKIGLVGFTFSHENMGCQALTCAFLEQIKKAAGENKKIKIVNFQGEKHMGDIPGVFPEMEFISCQIKMKDAKFMFWKALNSCDVIFDATFGDGFSDIYFVKSVYRNALVKYLMGRSKIPFVLAPQTYGPFRHKTLELLASQAIKNANYVFARDEISGSYAAQISGREVKTVTDLAFVLPYRRAANLTSKKRLGINISGLLWKGGFTDSNQFGLLTNYQEYCEKLIQYGLDEGFEVHVIPHVTKSAVPGKDIFDGDYPSCKQLVSKYPDAILAPCFSTPYEAKDYIADMDFFVGARMHATIGAFSSGVKTIPFAYSRKFQGLYDNLDYPYYVDGTKSSTDDALKTTINYINSPKLLEQATKHGMNQVHIKTQEFEQALHKILSSVGSK